MFRCYLYSDKTTQKDRYIIPHYIRPQVYRTLARRYTYIIIHRKVPTARHRGCCRNLIAMADKEPYKPFAAFTLRKGREIVSSIVREGNRKVGLYERDPGTILKRVIKRHDRADPHHAWISLAALCALVSTRSVSSSPALPLCLSFSLFLPAPSTVPPPPPFFSPRRLVLLLPLMPGLTAKTTKRALSYGARCDAAI